MAATEKVSETLGDALCVTPPLTTFQVKTVTINVSRKENAMARTMAVVVLIGFLFMLFGVTHTGDAPAVLSSLAVAVLLGMLFLMAEAVRVLELIRRRLAKDSQTQ